MDGMSKGVGKKEWSVYMLIRPDLSPTSERSGLWWRVWILTSGSGWVSSTTTVTASGTSDAASSDSSEVAPAARDAAGKMKSLIHVNMYKNPEEKGPTQRFMLNTITGSAGELGIVRTPYLKVLP